MDVSQQFMLLNRNLLKISGFDSAIFGHLAHETSQDIASKIMIEFGRSISAALPILNQKADPKQRAQLDQILHKLLGNAELLGFKEIATDMRELKNNASLSEAQYEIKLRVVIQALEASLSQINSP